MFAALVLIGILAHGCSDNNGRVTPTSAKVTGDALGGPAGTIVVTVTVNPGTIDIGRRGSVLVIVTNIHGIGIEGRTVQLTAFGGNLDATSGVTGAGGLFSTTIVVPCGTTAGIGAVIAVVDGVSSPATFNFATVTPATNDPCL